MIISLSPHIHSGRHTSRIMWTVIIALLPTVGVALWVFGIPALWVLLVSVATCMAAEWVIDRFCFRRKSTLTNGSAIITGILLACCLPSILPLWMVIIGGVVAIGIGKMSFGGLGCNVWNPALVGRVFLLISFPAAMTTWPSGVLSGIDAHSGATVDAHSGATFLATLNDTSSHLGWENVDMWQVTVGQMNGSLGEVGAIAILIGAVILLAMRVITWHIPVSVLVGAAGLSWALGGNPLLDILSGGLLLGAVFMATDYVTSPFTRRGQLLYGVMIGALTIVIRRYSAYPEGVSFAILLMNSFVPLINHYIKPRRFGAVKHAKK